MTAPVDAESAAAFAAATARLAELTTALAAAEALVAGGDARLSISAGHVRRAEAAAAVAVHSVEAIEAELSAVRALLRSAKLSVAGDARRAYQDGGMGAWGAVLGAENPAAFADRATRLEAVSATEDHATGLLTELPDRITALRSALSAAEERVVVTADEARAAASAYDRLAADLATARATVEPLRADVAAAVAAAKAAIPEEEALAVERRRESAGLAGEIVRASAALAEAGDVVSGTGTFFRPATGIVTSDYGWRLHPILGYQRLHTGVDYDGSDGVVYAADDGVVIMTVWSAGYGNVTVIDHGGAGGRSFTTLYGHQAGYFVDEGDVVRKGQPIGAVGSTGMSTGPHLHFEVRLDGLTVDPRPFL